MKLIINLLILTLIFFIHISFVVASPSVDISFTFRYENWNYFKFRDYQNSYSFYGLKMKPSIRIPLNERWKINIGLNIVGLGNLPTNAVAVSPGGPLGLGASYYLFNNSLNNSTITQLIVRDLNFSFKTKEFSLKIGRFPFIEGNELSEEYGNELKFIKSIRISQRLIGAQRFAYPERAFDGITFDYKFNNNQFTFLYSKPTYGGFELSTANRTLEKINLFYASFNKAIDKNSDLRIFWINYDDRRDILKPSNTPNIRGKTNISGVGISFIKVLDTKSHLMDFVLWYNYQWGKWGNLNNITIKHYSYAYDLEIGYKLKNANFKPYLRYYYFKSSGDGDPTDYKHNTYFSFLPSGRLYALFPFYNLQNLEEKCFQLILEPNAKTKIRMDYSDLKLSNENDGWYQGSGASNDSLFGYSYKRSFNSKELANVLSVSLNYELTKKNSVVLFYSIAYGKDIIKRTYDSSRASYFFIELNQKF